MQTSKGRFTSCHTFNNSFQIRKINKDSKKNLLFNSQIQLYSCLSLPCNTCLILTAMLSVLYNVGIDFNQLNNSDK